MFKKFCTSLVWLHCALALAAPRPDDHAPINVMGDHTHGAGEWMFSYRYMMMEMEGNRDGNSSVSSGAIATGEANRFAPPANLRVVPTEMTMQMHMLGAMYGITDDVTLMLMGNYIEKSMDHITFMGMMGDTELGNFETETAGMGDTQVSVLLKLHDEARSRLVATLGVSIPTGDIEEEDSILTPMDSSITTRLPYPMQLGSGSYDAIVGLTYAGHSQALGWGAQWRSVIRTERNDEGYSLGDEHSLQGWLSHQLNEHVGVSARLSYSHLGNIDGIDDEIALPVQTADPDRQGRERVDLGVGLNFLMPNNNHRLGLEIATPLSQNLDGPQLETDWVATIGWQYRVGENHSH